MAHLFPSGIPTEPGLDAFNCINVCVRSDRWPDILHSNLHWDKIPRCDGEVIFFWTLYLTPRGIFRGTLSATTVFVLVVLNRPSSVRHRGVWRRHRLERYVSEILRQGNMTENMSDLEGMAFLFCFGTACLTIRWIAFRPLLQAFVH